MHPGKVLAEIYLKEMALTQTELSKKIGCSHAKVNEIINGKRGVC
jgi:plasmid maintenance system antidote protein VapI